MTVSSESAETAGRPTTPQRNFTAVARRYDSINRILTCGRITVARRKAIDSLPTTSNKFLDLCCGTGEFGRALRLRYPGSTIIGVDINRSMLAQAVSRDCYDLVLAQDVATLELPPGSFNCVVLSLAYHDLGDGGEQVLAMSGRLLAPAGRLVSLELSLPESPLMRWLLVRVLRALESLLTILSRPVLAHTVREIRMSPDWRSVVHEFEAAGFSLMSTTTFLLGVLRLNIYIKGRTHDPA
ncbi:class I SAM-dependent methyltransferase [Actinomyces wuliandei]|uniref:class I SAM-dependent methyltransferase n=1 Tax=Actinomyces wuliandei TaxID=2057743 RepID=UPI0013E2D6C8|nr:class I SAM-dependent methyltransferase [Actinomyces wuliandei]